MKNFIFIILLIPALIFANEYKRSDWPHWSDLDKDCQNSRAETLIRDSQIPVTFETDKQCRVEAGEWLCPYTGRTFYLDGKIDIDHMVPLGNAHKNGAENWTKEQRKAFANDPENLFAVYLGANRSKGSRGPEVWQPDMNRQEYARHWIYIKEKYKLSYAHGELKALGGMLDF